MDSVCRMARTPQQHEHADRSQDDERQDKSDLAISREHLKKSVSHSLNPLRL
jgi:hypothetical protein